MQLEPACSDKPTRCPVPYVWWPSAVRSIRSRDCHWTHRYRIRATYMQSKPFKLLPILGLLVWMTDMLPGACIVGNQGGTGRDPLTFLTSGDGLAFDKHWIVQSDAPMPKWYGPRGWQYPSFMWCTNGCSGSGSGMKDTMKDTIIFSYSVSKEDIELTIAPLPSLGL